MKLFSFFKKVETVNPFTPLDVSRINSKGIIVLDKFMQLEGYSSSTVAYNRTSSSYTGIYYISKATFKPQLYIRLLKQSDESKILSFVDFLKEEFPIEVEIATNKIVNSLTRQRTYRNNNHDNSNNYYRNNTYSAGYCASEYTDSTYNSCSSSSSSDSSSSSSYCSSD